MLTLLLKIISPRKAEKVSEVRDRVEEWELEVRRLGKEYGADGEISGKIKMALLMLILPNKLLDTLYAHVDLGKGYEVVRQKVMDIIENQMGREKIRWECGSNEWQERNK